jgi:FixJ family two-component response regulator
MNQDSPMAEAADAPTVIIIDDDEAVRDALVIFLRLNGYLAKSYPSADEFAAAWEIPARGCIVADVKMRGMSGIDLIHLLRQRGCMLPILIITGHGDVPMAVSALRAGALDFIEKPLQDHILLERVREATALGARIQAEEEVRRATYDRFVKLSGREREVLTLIVEGLPNKIIAHRLGVSIRTVEIHRARVMEKFGAKSLPELVRFALQVESYEADESERMKLQDEA